MNCDSEWIISTNFTTFFLKSSVSKFLASRHIFFIEFDSMYSKKASSRLIAPLATSWINELSTPRVSENLAKTKTDLTFFRLFSNGYSLMD